MTPNEFERELQYQIIMFFFRRMLSEGLITAEEYCQIDTKERQKFLPITGALISGKSLIFPGFRANITAEKEENYHENNHEA